MRDLREERVRKVHGMRRKQVFCVDAETGKWHLGEQGEEKRAGAAEQGRVHKDEVVDAGAHGEERHQIILVFQNSSREEEVADMSLGKIRGLQAQYGKEAIQ
jgi:hypothetical protein